MGLTISESNTNGSSHLSSVTWSSHRVKRSVSASFVGEVFMLSEGLAEGEWIQGVLGIGSLARLRSLLAPTMTFSSTSHRWSQS